MDMTLINEATKQNCIRLMQDPDYVRDNIYIGLQRTSEPSGVKKAGPFPGTEAYLYVRGSLGAVPWQVRLQEQVLDDVYLTEEEAWAYARDNTLAAGRTVITSLPVLLEDLGVPELAAESGEGPRMYVVTNPQRCKGAAQILDHDTIRGFFQATEPGCGKLLVIPSSVHECILIPVPGDETFDLEAFHTMVREVNLSTVDAREQLADRCFEMRL